MFIELTQKLADLEVPVLVNVEHIEYITLNGSEETIIHFGRTGYRGNHQDDRIIVTQSYETVTSAIKLKD